MKVVIITNLYPENNEQSVAKVTFAIKKLVSNKLIQCELGITELKVLRPLTNVKWKGLSIANVFRCSAVDGIEVTTRSFFNLPKVPVFPILSDHKFLEDYFLDVDYVISHMPHSGAFAKYVKKRYGIPFTYVIHGSDLNNLKVLRKCSEYSDRILARSFALENQLKTEGIHVDGVCFSGVNTKRLDVKHKRLYTGAPKDLKIISVCSLIGLKNIDVVIEALGRLDRCLLWSYDIIGSGDKEASLRKAVNVKGLQDKVTFWGYKEKGFCEKMLRESDVFIMPSAPESLGLAYLEAMACGCIVIGSKGWGVDGIVENEKDGYLVSPRSVEDLTEVIQYIYNNSQVEVLENGFNKIQGYTEEIASKNYFIECLPIKL
jgi:glycosyltransferase involved in cell wall biosynthesis